MLCYEKIRFDNNFISLEIIEAIFIFLKIWLADKKAIFFKKLMDNKDTFNTKNVIKKD